ncbi:MAG: Uncharacterised protein [Halieaceae bacterium]|nr:MAG: Uncharacterised protein [Halieaceae bacterium]
MFKFKPLSTGSNCKGPGICIDRVRNDSNGRHSKCFAVEIKQIDGVAYGYGCQALRHVEINPTLIAKPCKRRDNLARIKHIADHLRVNAHLARERSSNGKTRQLCING